MGQSRRVRKYAKEHFTEVQHTTLNPEGPGVVRIHLLPPEISGNVIGASVAILNGQFIVPVNVGWTIVLTELISRINTFSGREVTEDEVATVIDETCKAVKKVYPFARKKRIKNDIFRIMNTFSQIARGEEVTEDIQWISLGDYAPFMRAPHRMDLMVSAMTKEGRWHCNQQCVHCYAAGQAQSEEAELDTESWKKILDRCREIGIPQVTFTGGEPTMRDDLFDLISHARWFISRLNTNGIKLTPEYCAKLREAELDSVQITFYSCDPKVHNMLVGAEHFPETVAGIENALAAGLSVSINTPLCTANRDYVKTLEYLHGKGVTYVTCSGLITTGNAAKEKSESLQLSEEEIREILRDAVAYCAANSMEISFTSPGWVDGAFCEELGITTPTCGACLSNMAITPGGNVVPCQSWLSGDVLGNFLTDDWKTIWKSEACRERRDYSAAMEGKCPLRIRKGGEEQ